MGMLWKAWSLAFGATARAARQAAVQAGEKLTGARTVS
jgi:hypothetical protein